MAKYNQPQHDFIISDVSKDKEFQSAANEEQQMYHEKIKELENMVCELTCQNLPLQRAAVESNSGHKTVVTFTSNLHPTYTNEGCNALERKPVLT